MGYIGTVHVEQFTNSPFSFAQAYAQDDAREAERGGKSSVIYAGPFRRRVVFTFETRVDSTEPGRQHDETGICWKAEMPLLPDFTGTLRMRIAMPGTLLVLDGRYVPPGGAFGSFFDRLIGKRIARATAEALLGEFAKTLAGREQTWREGVASV